MTKRFSFKFIRPILFRFEIEAVGGDLDTLKTLLVSDGDSIRCMHSQRGKMGSSTVEYDLASAINKLSLSTDFVLLFILRLLLPNLAIASLPPLGSIESPRLREDLAVRKDGISVAVLDGHLGNWSTFAYFDLSDLSVVEIEMQATESEEIRAKRREAILITRQYAPEKLENIEIPEDALLSMTNRIVFEEREFNDSLTVDSILS